MKKILFFFIGMCFYFPVQAQMVPDEIVDLFDDVSSVAAPEEDVNYQNHVFSVRINKSIIQKDYAKYIVKIICEDSYFEPEYWQGIDFQIIEVRNRDNNSGYRINIDKTVCAAPIKHDWSDNELEERIFKYGLKKF